jgi:hypothetical protein
LTNSICAQFCFRTLNCALFNLSLGHLSHRRALSFLIALAALVALVALATREHRPRVHARASSRRAPNSA